MMPVLKTEHCRRLIWTLCLLLAFPLARAGVLDTDSAADPLLDDLAMDLESLGMDVARNLNQRDIARGRPARPRLGAFADLPPGDMPDTPDLLAFEQDLGEGRIGGLALLVDGGTAGDAREFMNLWHRAAAPQRVFITFHQSDLESATLLAGLLQDQGHGVLPLTAEQSTELAGRLFAVAGRRLAIDSATARRHRSELREFRYLGRRLARNSDSLIAVDGRIPVARNEPSVFRKASLGDEFEASTIEEIIVPGGIAFGEQAQLDFEPQELVFREGGLLVRDTAGNERRLPRDLPLPFVKALWDFTVRAEALRSDAVVDIDGEGRVRISEALRDTDIGYELVQIDTLPFEFVRNLPVTKSVIIDTAVVFRENGQPGLMDYDTRYEVRFLSADTMRIAQTRVALEYRLEAAGSDPEFGDQWGRDIGRLDENLDYTGLGSSTAPVARYAAWSGLFRLLQSGNVTFVEGRYDFMKIDKSGRRTPARF